MTLLTKVRHQAQYLMPDEHAERPNRSVAKVVFKADLIPFALIRNTEIAPRCGNKCLFTVDQRGVAMVQVV